MMRIISGTARGRKLTSPPTDAVRPTQDRVREALFSMLGNIHGAIVVDAFAGSGALGLEALSRGAQICYFFDTSRDAIRTIRENVQRLGFEDRAIICHSSFRNALSTEIDTTPDLWFFDPPYESSLAEEGLRAMASATETVTPGALIVWESLHTEEIFEVPGFELTRSREYGTTRVAFFRRLDTPEVGANTLDIES